MLEVEVRPAGARIFVDGEPRSYTLRATQVYRREAGEWKVAHRHGDTVTAAGRSPA